MTPGTIFVQCAHNVAVSNDFKYLLLHRFEPAVIEHKKTCSCVQTIELNRNNKTK